MLVRGIVGEIETAHGEIEQAGGLAAQPWMTVKVWVGSEEVKFPHRFDAATGAFQPKGHLVVPSEGDEVEVSVDLDLKQNSRSLLAPFKLVIVAQECSVLRTAAQRDEERATRSLESVPSPRAPGKPRAAAKAS